MPPILPPARWVPYLADDFRLPRRVFREVSARRPTLEDFRSFWAENPDNIRDANTVAGQLARRFGISVWVERAKVVELIEVNGSGGLIAELDLGRAAWAKVTLMRHGDELHMELLGEPKRMLECVAAVKGPSE